MGSLITHRFTFACEFHGNWIFELAVYLLVEIKSFLKTRALTKDLAGAFLVGIEVWFGDLLLKCIELSPLAVDVKETSHFLTARFKLSESFDEFFVHDGSPSPQSQLREQQLTR